MSTLGIYISVPFCRAKCTFCNFASGAFSLDRLDAYVGQLGAEIRASRAFAVATGAELPQIVDTVYFGGGTPSLLTPAQLSAIFSALRSEFSLTDDAEITLESAPGQLASETLAEAVALGVNRISFGVQTFVDGESAAVGRLHTAATCLEDLRRVRAAGIESISLDLIAGLPGQTAASWQHSVDAVIDAGVPHASLYMLEVDEESRLGKELIGGGVRYGAGLVPNDDMVAEFYAQGCDRFEAAGLAQYEISNFARPGAESRHNLKYWSREPYLGLGVDAHSMLRRVADAVRFSNPESLEDYAAGGQRPINIVDRTAAFEEALFLGLRRNSGVSLQELQAEFGSHQVRALRGSIDHLIAGQMLAQTVAQTVAQTGDRISLTPRGRSISNEVFSELLCVLA